MAAARRAAKPARPPRARPLFMPRSASVQWRVSPSPLSIGPRCTSKLNSRTPAVGRLDGLKYGKALVMPRPRGQGIGAALGWRSRRCGRDAHCGVAMADCRPFRESTCGYLANRSPTAPGGIRFLGAGKAPRKSAQTDRANRLAGRPKWPARRSRSHVNWQKIIAYMAARSMLSLFSNS